MLANSHDLAHHLIALIPVDVSTCPEAEDEAAAVEVAAADEEEDQSYHGIRVTSPMRVPLSSFLYA